MLAAIAVLAMSAGVPCVVTARDIAAGEHISAELIEPANCRADRPPARRLRFDRQTRTVTAGEALPMGTYLGRLWAPRSTILPKGARATLRVRSGPAVVERRVMTLQPARSGQRVFVRDESGNIFAAALALSDQDPQTR